ncbi:MAG: ABC transporter permease [Clostridia bacterium]|nr:ABC transporter permease [Clostridia bacterium]
MKTYMKTLARMFKKHAARFVSVILIVLVAVGFISGLGSAGTKMTTSMTSYYKSQNVSDVIAKSTADSGFTEDQVQAVKDLDVFSGVETGASVDVYIGKTDRNPGGVLTRLYFLDSLNDGLAVENITVNTPEAEAVYDASGNTAYPVAFEAADNAIIGYSELETVHLDFIDIMDQLMRQNSGYTEGLDNTSKGYLEQLLTYTDMDVTVTQEWASPLTFALDGEPSYLNGLDADTPVSVTAANDLIGLENILYLPSSYLPEISFAGYSAAMQQVITGLTGLSEGPLLGTMDMYASLADRNVFDAFSNEYEQEIDADTAALSVSLGTDVQFITLYENYSFLSMYTYAKDVTGIGYIMMVVFLLVTVLIVLSTMSRLVEEERSQTACLKTLGYSSWNIISKYILFAVIALAIGVVGGYFVGMGLSSLIYFIFNYCLVMPSMTVYSGVLFFVITAAVIVVATLGGTIWAGLKETREKPADLLRPKPPKAGRKVVLEQFPFIWNRLSFNQKSTIRNVMRYPLRFTMTVVSVAIATALVMVGLALLDLCLFGGIASAAITGVSIVVVFFAGFLSILVVYTLTYINVSERERELATLDVLGYVDYEVCNYIYREVYIDTTVGIIFGVPLSVPLMLILFSVIGMGTLAGFTWFWWLIGMALPLAFTSIVTLMLGKKITCVDMNKSLKAVE